MKIYTYDPKKQKTILAGEVLEENYLPYFLKKVTKRHYMILERGFGISESVLQQLIHLGVTDIRIKTKTGIILSNLEDWLKRPIKNYGHGKQRFLGGK